MNFQELENEVAVILPTLNLNNPMNYEVWIYEDYILFEYDREWRPHWNDKSQWTEEYLYSHGVPKPNLYCIIVIYCQHFPDKKIILKCKNQDLDIGAVLNEKGIQYNPNEPQIYTTQGVV